jgi:hypothetical protein
MNILPLNLSKFPVLTCIAPISDTEIKRVSNTFDTHYLETKSSHLDSFTLFTKKANSKNSLFSVVTKQNRNASSGYYIEIVLFGLFHTAKRTRMYKLPFHLKLNQSHNVSCYEHPFSSVRTRIFKRRVIFFSNNKSHLVSIVNSLEKRRPADSYHGHGIGIKGHSYSLLEGKVRQK